MLSTQPSPTKPFKQLVALYRLLARPAVVNHSFSATVIYSRALSDVLSVLAKSNQFDIELSINRYSFDLDESCVMPVIELGKTVTITIRFYCTEKAFFYQNAKAWLALAPSLSKGRIADNTYLIDEDQYIGESNRKTHPSAYKVIQAVQLIQCLKRIAEHHHNHTLVFFIGDDKKSLLMDTQLTSAILTHHAIDFSLLASLTPTNSGNVYSMYDFSSLSMSVLNQSVAAFINTTPKPTILYLISHWPAFAKAFNQRITNES